MVCHCSLTEGLDKEVQMSNEILRNVALEQDDFGLGVILKSLDYVGEAGESVLTPDVHLWLRIVKGDFKNAVSRLVGSKPRIDGKVEGDNGGQKQRDCWDVKQWESHV